MISVITLGLHKDIILAAQQEQRKIGSDQIGSFNGCASVIKPSKNYEMGC